MSLLCLAARGAAAPIAAPRRALSDQGFAQKLS
jgi:hypothetical protein